MSGSTKEVRMFLSKGTLPTFMQSGLVEQGSGGLV